VPRETALANLPRIIVGKYQFTRQQITLLPLHDALNKGSGRLPFPIDPLGRLHPTARQVRRRGEQNAWEKQDCQGDRRNETISFHGANLLSG